GRGVRSADPLRRGDQAVVRAPHPRLQRPVVALARDVEDRGATLAERLDDRLVQRPRPREGAGDEKDRTVGRQLEDLPCLALWDGARPGRDRTADDLEARLVPSFERIGEV